MVYKMIVELFRLVKSKSRSSLGVSFYSGLVAGSFKMASGINWMKTLNTCLSCSLEFEFSIELILITGTNYTTLRTIWTCNKEALYKHILKSVIISMNNFSKKS